MHLTESTLCAAAILKAWGEADTPRLERHLADASALQANQAGSQGEQERLELLGGIASEICGFVQAGQTPAAAVYLPLLRHLAQPGPSGLDRSVD